MLERHGAAQAPAAAAPVSATGPDAAVARRAEVEPRAGRPRLHQDRLPSIVRGENGFFCFQLTFPILCTNV